MLVVVLSRRTVNAMVDCLERQGYVERESKFGTLVPTGQADFLEVSGVGETKAGRYGAAFLEEIRRWRAEAP